MASKSQIQRFLIQQIPICLTVPQERYRAGQGLNTILSISVPILNAIYPVSIVLIVPGLCDKFISGNRFIYPFTILGTAVISVIYAIDGVGICLGFVSKICRSMPFRAKRKIHRTLFYTKKPEKLLH